MRCKACDSSMTPNEIIWDEERQEHEELCLSCRKFLLSIEDEDLPAISYPEDGFEMFSLENNDG